MGCHVGVRPKKEIDGKNNAARSSIVAELRLGLETVRMSPLVDSARM